MLKQKEGKDKEEKKDWSTDRKRVETMRRRGNLVEVVNNTVRGGVGGTEGR